MNNLSSPTFPTQIFLGLTKLEYASLLIAAKMSARIYEEGITDKQATFISESSVFLAKKVLGQANKLPG